MRFRSTATPVLSRLIKSPCGFPRPAGTCPTSPLAVSRFSVLRLLVFLVLTSCLASCTDDPPTPPPPPASATIELSLDEAGVTEVWLRVTVSSPVPSTSWILERGGEEAIGVAHAPTDTVVMDDSLSPGQIQNYKAIRFENQTRVDSTPVLQVRTMDTTSHEFTWEIEYLGVASLSTLYDVAIINDTLAYAVGEIYLRDSSGNTDPTPYNAARWNGVDWEVMRVPYIFAGHPVVSEARWIFPLGESNILFGNSVRWNGGGFENADLGASIFPGIRSNKMWGRSSGDLYWVGSLGTIAHFEGGSWKSIPSGTALPIRDVYGSMATNSTEVLAIASNLAENQGMRLLSLDLNGSHDVSVSGLSWRLSGVWFIPGRYYVVVGDGLFVKRRIDNGNAWEDLAPGLTVHFIQAVRGFGLNNIVAVGHFGSVLHYNGSSWKNLQARTAIDGIYTSVSVRGRMVMVVGQSSAGAVILKGTSLSL